MQISEYIFRRTPQEQLSSRYDAAMETGSYATAKIISEQSL